MTALKRDEFVALRATIRERGTLRVWLFVLITVAWGLVAGLSADQWPGMLIPLVILAAGFEAVSALHFNVERIGRYLQAFYEEGAADAESPAWETTAMTFAQRHQGAGFDPLFGTMFLLATIVNLIASAAHDERPIVLAALALAHVLFVVRIFSVRRRAGAQRAEDLERYRHLARSDREKVAR